MKIHTRESVFGDEPVGSLFDADGALRAGTEPGEAASCEAFGATFYFRWVPPGEFWRGARGKREVERPVSKFVMPGFWMMETPVTQGQYAAVGEQQGWSDPCPSYCKEGAPAELALRPVEQVNWKEALRFCEALNAALGLGHAVALASQDDIEGSFDTQLLNAYQAIRLPTEIEWEYACRAGSDTDYWNGDGEAALAAVGWYSANSGDRTHGVYDLATAQAKQHPYKLLQLHGNVWEWIWDGWDAAQYRQIGAGEVRPLPRVVGDLRVFRGGAWCDSAAGCRSAVRNWRRPLERGSYLGFRACLPLPSPATSMLPEGKAGGGAQAVAEQAQPKPPMRPEADAAIDLADEQINPLDEV